MKKVFKAKSYVSNNERVQELKKKVTNAMNEKLGHIYKNHAEAIFTFKNNKEAKVTRDYIGCSDHKYQLIFEGDVLCETKNPYTCGWALYVLGCDNKK